MQVGILNTSSGTHPVDEWAYVSATMILNAIQVSGASANRVQLEMLKDSARSNVTQALQPDYATTKLGEQNALVTDPMARANLIFNPSEFASVETTVTAVLNALQPILDYCETAQLVPGASGMPVDPGLTIEAYLQTLVRERVETDLRTIMQIERSWFADQNPSSDFATAYNLLRGV